MLQKWFRILKAWWHKILNTFTLLLLPKEQSWKIIAFAHFKKLSTKQKVTNIYRFTSGLLSTTNLFQIQASTGDSKETYLKHRLFSLPGSSVCHVCAKRQRFLHLGTKKYPWCWKMEPIVRNGFWDLLGLKKPLSLDGYHITT
jgi:hypothetical protein